MTPGAEGLLMTAFILWMGVGQVGLLVAAVLLLAGRGTARRVEAASVCALTCASMLPPFILGRPRFIGWLLPLPDASSLWPDFHSPMLRAILALAPLLVLASATFLFGLLPDLARLRDRSMKPSRRFLYGLLALGWRGSCRQRALLLQTRRILAWLALLMVLAGPFASSRWWMTCIVPGVMPTLGDLGALVGTLCLFAIIFLGFWLFLPLVPVSVDADPSGHLSSGSGRSSIWGLSADFPDASTLALGAVRVREAGFVHWDCLTRDPIGELGPAMGLRVSRIRWVVLGAGLIGAASAVLFQWWANAMDQPLHVGDLPLFSFMGSLPVAVTTAVLCSALCVIVGALLASGLPAWRHPLLRIPGARYRISIEAVDPRFNGEETRSLLLTLGATSVGFVEERAVSPWLRRSIYFLVVLMGVSVALIQQPRATSSRKPGFHVFSNMERQPASSPGITRAPVEGTLAYGSYIGDSWLTEGRVDDRWAPSPPFTVSQATLERGRERYEIHCAPCHGFVGQGDGTVSSRSHREPTDLLSDRVTGMPAGLLFATISQGAGAMPAFRSLVQPRDRWAIVAYLRALEKSQEARIEDVPAELRPSLPLEDAAQRRSLQGYRWIDRASGRLAIPIDRAMALAVEDLNAARSTSGVLDRKTQKP